MTRMKISVSQLIGALFLSMLVVMLAFSWYISGLLVNKPLEQRHDFCSDKAATCAGPLLEKYGLSDEYESVELTSFDGTVLRGLYFPSHNDAAVIVQHGYGGHLGNVLHIANMLHLQGYGVVAMDLRAHGSSGGEQVTFGRDEAKDMQVVFDFLKAQDGVDAGKIGLYGWSLGGATVLLHGTLNDEVQAVVADSPYDAINYANFSEFTDAPWPLPHLFRFFSSLRTGVDYAASAPIENLAAYSKTPLFILIAGADTVVDPDSGERLLSRINNPKVRVWREPELEHVRFSFDAAEKFSNDIGAFFDQHLHPSIGPAYHYRPRR